ncbi:conjugative transfer signal peptidase TraF [Pseudoalteromonas galatheae]|uniref:conjugative transfer signal peptidase TraF n=1 Tax=Pseudoalteromonas galatheae TaxID=579562 RepID=UPI0030D0B742
MTKLTKVASVVLITVFTLLLLSFSAGIRVNYTESYPTGLYIVSSSTPKKGDLVNFCPPDSAVIRFAYTHRLVTTGFCEHGYGQLMKAIVATTGDTIETTPYGLRVNGHLLKNSKPLNVDGLSIYTAHKYTLLKDEVLLMSTFNPTSFDGRYFGVISTKHITEVVEPLFTFITSPNIQFMGRNGGPSLPPEKPRGLL